MAKPALYFLVAVLLGGSALAQHEGHAPPQQPPAKQSRGVSPRPLPPVESELKKELARGPSYTLQALEQLAMRSNPTLAQAQAEIRAAEGRQRQAGLWPNPVVGYIGEEIRGGALRGGQHGFFVEQPILLGGKLRRNQQIFTAERNIAAIEADEQRLRVSNAVRLGFFQVLASQELLDARLELARLAAENHTTAIRLRNVGTLDDTEVLQARIEAQRAQLAVRRQENQLRRDWTSLSAILGKPELRPGWLEGSLATNLPSLNEADLVQALLSQSPALLIAEASVERSRAAAAAARAQRIPDLTVRGGLQQNRELVEGGNRAVGLQGLAEVGIGLPIFNRNQGNIRAAEAQLERSQREVERIRLVLRERAGATIQAYRNAWDMAEQYRGAVVPDARAAYEMMLRSWGQMAASYPQLLLAQRTLAEVNEEYITSLQELWTASVALQGFLLTDGLEAPARPDEVEMPVRELNLPMNRAGGGGNE
jgi:cobalt-zinc-cadmium efflux system outer membrane protein